MSHYKGNMNSNIQLQFSCSSYLIPRYTFPRNNLFGPYIAPVCVSSGMIFGTQQPGDVPCALFIFPTPRFTWLPAIFFVCRIEAS